MSLLSWEDCLAAARDHQHIPVARYGCSSLEKLEKCGSYKYESGDRSPAIRGTALHALVELPENDWPMDLPDAERDALLEAQAMEARLGLTQVVRNVRVGGGLFDFGGHIDLMGWNQATLLVADYKFGGKPVEADCLQLIAYAHLSGAAQTAIIQPGRQIQIHTVTQADKDRLAVALERIRSGKLRTGEHCHSCDRRDECDAYANFRADAIERVVELSAARLDGTPTLTIPDDPDLQGRLLTCFDNAEAVIKAGRQVIKDRMLAGGKVDGWKIVPGKRQTTAWKALAEEHCTKDQIAAATTVNEYKSLRRTKT